MRTFNLFNSHSSLFQNAQPEIVRIIREAVPAEMIYLLGASLYQRRTETIFNCTSPASNYMGDYFLLVIVPDLEGRPMSEWEDILEQKCAPVMRTTIIVMQKGRFTEKYKEGNIFATSAQKAGAVLYDAGSIELPDLNEIEVKQPREWQKEYEKTLHRATEFLAGADLYIARDEAELAAFMIHQCFEQSLKTLILIGSGFVVDTHSIDRLLRYAGLVTYKLLEVFPADQVDRKKQLELLQKSYVGARYAYDFSPAMLNVLKLREKAKLVLDILLDAGKSGLLDVKALE